MILECIMSRVAPSSWSYPSQTRWKHYFLPISQQQNSWAKLVAEDATLFADLSIMCLFRHHGLRSCPALGIRWLEHARRGCRNGLISVRSKWWFPEDLLETGKCEKAQEAAGLKETLGCFTLAFMLRTSMESTYRVWWQAPNCKLFSCLCILIDFFPNTFLN